MGEPLEFSYFNWLCSKVVDDSKYNEVGKLLNELHMYEFVWLLSGDDNRADDCHDLRLDFFRENGVQKDAILYGRAASVLEVLVAFSHRAYFETDIPAISWFWTMLDNLGLTRFIDASYQDYEVINRILETFVWRTYDRNGNGGLFPLHDTKKDQRTVEIWYQFCEYLVENQYD